MAVLICYVIMPRNIWNAFIIVWFCSTFKTASDFSSHELKKRGNNKLNSQELIRDAQFLPRFSLQAAKFYLHVNLNAVSRCLSMD
jgi:hypothetical protein